MTDGQQFSWMSHPIIPNELRPLFGGLMTDSQPQMRFPTGTRQGQVGAYSVFVESTPDGDWWRMPTSEESLAAWRAEREAERDRERALIAEHAQLMTTATGLRRAVLELHAPDEDGYCTGCETDYDALKLSGCTTYALARGWPE